MCERAGAGEGNKIIETWETPSFPGLTVGCVGRVRGMERGRGCKPRSGESQSDGIQLLESRRYQSDRGT